MNNEKLEILDSTLRDAQRGIFCSDKLNILKALDDFGVKYIEAGNPVKSKDIEFFEKAKILN